MKKDLLQELFNNEYAIKEVDLKDINNILNENYKILLLTKNQNQIKIIIEKLLLELGIPSNLKGYTCLTEAIFLCLKNEKYTSNITKNLYPKVAKIVNIKELSVEKNIRKAIEIGCTNTNPELLEEIFGYSINIDKGKPTNSNYIKTIYNILR